MLPSPSSAVEVGSGTLETAKGVFPISHIPAFSSGSLSLITFHVSV